MALFTDTDVVTLDDLLLYEASLVQIASSHGINVETKINLASSTIGDLLLSRLLKVWIADPQWMTRRQLGLSTVVVTSPLHRWLCFDSLARFFAEAYNVQLNTRFQGKWTEYKQEATSASEMLFTSGLGIVARALPKPAMPLVSMESGSTSAQALFVQTAWVDGNGNEGALSPVNGVVLSAPSTVAVAMSEGVLNIPAAAVGWNVYASSTDSGLTRQNSAPLATGSTWELPSTGLVGGPQPIDGQQPDKYIDLSRRLQRG